MQHSAPPMPTPHQQAASAPQFASILIVDDQVFDRTRLVKMCRSFGFPTQAVQADSLAQMRDRLLKDRFDLVLLDYHLTDGTGLEGVEAIRADSVNSHAAIVMITGTAQHDIAIQALKLGFSDYLTKDELSEETLTRAAITALQKSQLTRGMAAQSRSRTQTSVQSFSRQCARDIKPIVSRIMRQTRGLRAKECSDPAIMAQRVERMEGSLLRLWSFLEDLDQMGAGTDANGPTVNKAAGINARVPSQRGSAATPKPPSVFRRRPDQGSSP